MSEQRARQALNKLLGQFQPKGIIREAKSGDGSSAETADVEGLEGWAWVRYDHEPGKVSQVRNRFCTGIPQDVPVLVGKTYEGGPFEILGVNFAYYDLGGLSLGSIQDYVIPQHGDRHTFPNGNDPAWINIENILPGQVRPAEGLYIYTETFKYEYQGELITFGGDFLDISGNLPAGAGDHRYVLIYLDPATNTLAATDGDDFPLAVSPTAPDATEGTIPLAILRTYNGETQVDDEDIIDYRLVFNKVIYDIPIATNENDTLQVSATLAPEWVTTPQFDAGVIFGGATTVNVLTVPDNIADALSIEDAGGTAIEYLRVQSSDFRPEIILMPSFQQIARVGLRFSDATIGGAGYGTYLYFSGAKSIDGTWDGDNSDPLWINRYNVANAQTELRVNISDNGDANHALCIGYTNGGWNEVYRFAMDGTFTGGGGTTGFVRTVNSTAAQNTIQPSADVVNLTLKQKAGGTANLFNITTSGGGVIFAVNSSGFLGVATSPSTAALISAVGTLPVGTGYGCYIAPTTITDSSLFGNITIASYGAAATGNNTKTITGFEGRSTNASTHTVAAMIGVSGYIYQTTTGTAPTVYNFNAGVDNPSGTITTRIAYRVADGANITNNYGFYCADLTGGTLARGLYLAVSSGASKHNVYAVGTADNYFVGNVGIGIASPTAKMHIVGSADTEQLIVKANGTQTDNIAEIQDSSANKLVVISPAGQETIGGAAVSAHYDLGLITSGVLMLKETTTPTADANYGKVYCKNDNKLYFQDGAGSEHEVALAT